jgi:hypothetical protein
LPKVVTAKEVVRSTLATNGITRKGCSNHPFDCKRQSAGLIGDSEWQ